MFGRRFSEEDRDWLCSLEDSLPCCISEMKRKGRLRAALPRVTSAILASVLLAASRHLFPQLPCHSAKLQGGRKGEGELPSLHFCAPQSLIFCAGWAALPHTVVTGAHSWKRVFRFFWQRGKGNLLSAVYECSQLLRKRETTPRPCSPRVRCKHIFSKPNLLAKVIASAVWIYEHRNGIRVWVNLCKYISARVCVQEEEVWYKRRLGQRQLLGSHLVVPGIPEFAVPTAPGNRRRHAAVFNIQI